MLGICKKSALARADFLFYFVKMCEGVLKRFNNVICGF